MSTTEESTTPTESTREPGFMGWVKFLWQEGLARKFIVTHEDKQVVNLPLLLVIVAAFIAPWLVAIGVILAVVLGASVSVERKADDDEEATETSPTTAPASEGDAGQA